MMTDLDRVDEARKRLEAKANPKTAETDQGELEQQPETQPEENGGGGRTFTQDEVNKIVSERLARERAKSSPTPEQTRDAELGKGETRLKCKEHLIDQGLPADLLNLLDTTDYDTFVDAVYLLEHVVMEAIETRQAQGESAVENELQRKQISKESLMREAFGLTPKG